jgi:hypothetical protein
MINYFGIAGFQHTMATSVGVKQQPVNVAEKGSVLRRGSQGKKPLKEKIVQIYEAFFRVNRYSAQISYELFF